MLNQGKGSANPPSVSVVVPCYNELRNIPILVKAIHDALAGFEHEILVVDDNSPDGTYKTMVEMNLPYVRAFLRATDRGLAKSIRFGIENATGDFVAVMDSDFNHQPSYLTFMAANMRFYDCVLASRFQYGGRMDPRSRHLLSWVFNIFTRIMTGGMVTDSLYGFFCIKREILKSLNYDKIFWGYGDYCIRLLFYVQQKNISILQFPAVNGRRLAGEGNSRFLKVFLQYFGEVLRLTWRERIRGGTSR